MLMDLHFHTEMFSRDSRMSLEAGLKRARAMGLDGVCITEHDVLARYGNLDEIAARYGLVVLTGVEILTLDGDILCYGLDRVPDGMVDASTLTSMLDTMGGATVAAHPYRDNNRGG
jgi:predicted metal-dependent phosphoesterase TrpH